MAEETLRITIKWILAILILLSLIWMYYFILFPKAGELLWDNLKSSIKFGSKKLETGFHELPQSVIDNIKEISGEIKNDEHFNKETGLNRNEIKLSSMGNYKIKISKSEEGKSIFYALFKDQVYTYPGEIDYVPCVVNMKKSGALWWKNFEFSPYEKSVESIVFEDEKNLRIGNEKEKYEFYGLIKRGDRNEKENICFVIINNEGYNEDIKKGDEK